MLMAEGGSPPPLPQCFSSPPPWIRRHPGVVNQTDERPVPSAEQRFDDRILMGPIPSTLQTKQMQTPLPGETVVSVAESALAPPGPIPNPVVTQGSAGEYCGGDPVGGEAAAGTTVWRGRE